MLSLLCVVLVMLNVANLTFVRNTETNVFLFSGTTMIVFKEGYALLVVLSGFTGLTAICTAP